MSHDWIRWIDTEQTNSKGIPCTNNKPYEKEKVTLLIIMINTLKTLKDIEKNIRRLVEYQAMSGQICNTMFLNKNSGKKTIVLCYLYAYLMPS